MAGDREIDAEAQRLGVNGMFLETDQRLPYGAEVTVRLPSPSPRAYLEVPATVRWTSERGMGVQTPSLRPAQIWAIHRLTR